MFASFVYPKALKLGHSQNKGPKLISMCSLAFCECLPLVSPLVKQAVNHELRHSSIMSCRWDLVLTSVVRVPCTRLVFMPILTMKTNGFHLRWESSPWHLLRHHMGPNLIPRGGYKGTPSPLLRLI
jgi:hypothetical protein